MTDFDCIVLGAGISGVTAGRELRRAGFKVMIIEAVNRVGGRMRTLRDFVKHPGIDPAKYPVEAGAEYIHVTLQKRVVQEAKNKPLRVLKGRYKEFWAELDKGGFKPRELEKIGSVLTPGHNRLFFQDWERPKDLISAVMGDSNLCKVKQIFDDVRTEPPGLKPVGEFVDESDFEGKGRVLARYTLTGHTPGSGAKVSVYGLSLDGIMDQLQDPSEFRIENKKREIVGYDRLPRMISEQFTGGETADGEPGVLRLACIVTQVQKLADGNIKVTCRDSDGQEKEFTARAALCTFAAGVLNPTTGSGERIFGPLLTESKRRALQIIHMGPITKFSLEFKKEVWGDPRTSVLSNPEGKARTFFSSFPKDKSEPPFVLTGLLMGTDHDWINQFPSDQARVAALLEEIQKICDPNEPKWKMEDCLVNRNGSGPFEPNFHRQAWSVDDPLTGGGNSFISVDGASADFLRTAREDLKSPLETIPLFWAGEATAPVYHRKYQPLCVHGAYISGIEAARDITAFLEANGQLDVFRDYYERKYLALGLAADLAAVDRTEAAAEPLTISLGRPERVFLEAHRRALRLRTIEATAERFLTQLLEARVPLEPKSALKGPKLPKGVKAPKPSAKDKVRLRVNLHPDRMNFLRLEASKITKGNLAKAAELYLIELAERHRLEKRRGAKKPVRKPSPR